MEESLFIWEIDWPFHCHPRPLVLAVQTRDGQGRAFSSEAGRGEGENPRGGAGRGGAKERVNRLIQKFENSAYIVMEIFVVYYDVLINENIISSHF